MKKIILVLKQGISSQLIGDTAGSISCRCTVNVISGRNNIAREKMVTEAAAIVSWLADGLID